MYTVTRRIEFCYGHRLLNYSGKCRHLHGHNGRALIVLEGEELDERGMLIDFTDIKAKLRTWIDDERLSLWNQVSILAGFADNVVEVVTGYITDVKPYFHAELSQCYLDVKGIDSSVLMSTEEKLKNWPNKKDSDIAKCTILF